MGYTHYWRRPEQLDAGKFKSWASDCQKIINHCKGIVPLAGGSGEGDPVVNANQVFFNGAIKCGHLKQELHIPWPATHGNGLAQFGEDVITEQWFAGDVIQKRTCNGDCSYETFMIERCVKKKYDDGPLVFAFCKTAFRPYDWPVTACLVAFKHHFGDAVIVSTDGEDEHWQDGRHLCMILFEYGYKLRVTDGDLS